MKRRNIAIIILILFFLYLGFNILYGILQISSYKKSGFRNYGIPENPWSKDVFVKDLSKFSQADIELILYSTFKSDTAAIFTYRDQIGIQIFDIHTTQNDEIPEISVTKAHPGKGFGFHAYAKGYELSNEHPDISYRIPDEDIKSITLITRKSDKIQPQGNSDRNTFRIRSKRFVILFHGSTEGKMIVDYGSTKKDSIICYKEVRGKLRLIIIYPLKKNSLEEQELQSVIGRIA